MGYLRRDIRNAQASKGARSFSKKSKPLPFGMLACSRVPSVALTSSSQARAPSENPNFFLGGLASEKCQLRKSLPPTRLCFVSSRCKAVPVVASTTRCVGYLLREKSLTLQHKSLLNRSSSQSLQMGNLLLLECLPQERTTPLKKNLDFLACSVE